MTQIAAIHAPGLENIIVAETTLSHVDGQKGELILRGKAIDDIAGKQSFEEAVCHLWKGLLLPSKTNLTPAFGTARLKAFQAVEMKMLAFASPHWVTALGAWWTLSRSTTTEN